MSHAKHQHYVARLYLRRFACETHKNPRIWAFDKQRRTAVRPSIKNVAGEMYFYERTDTGVERGLQQIEDAFLPGYQQLCEGGGVDDLTAENRAQIALYLAVQQVRTPEFRQTLKSSVDGLKRWAEHYDHQIDPSLTEITEEECRKIQIGTLVDHTPQMAVIMVQMKWMKLRNETALPYWTSDHPVTLHNPIRTPGLGNLGLKCRGIQLLFPLSPTTALCLCDPVEYADLPNESATKDPQNVVFQNHLQMIASTRFVFSRSADFSLADEILRNDPRLADPDRKRVSIGSVDPES